MWWKQFFVLQDMPICYAISEYFQIKFFPRIMLGKDLPSIIEGNIIGQGRLAEPKTHKKGFLTYGPYINLPAGEYIFELSSITSRINF